MGYTNVRVYRDGYPGWAKAGYKLTSNAKYPKVSIPLLSPKDLKAKIDSGANIFLLDIRGKGMYKKAYIKGSVNIPLFILDKNLDKLPKDKVIVLIDHAGKQTLIAGRYLKSKGFAKVMRLDGGIMAWIRAGLPVEK